MTILSVAQRVAVAVGIARPAAVFSETTREAQEMQAFANEAAAVILDAHDWQKLVTLHTLTGSSSSEAFTLPAGYRRMLATGEVWLSRTRAPAMHIVDLNDWLDLDANALLPVEGVWTLFGDAMHLRPVLTASETARFFYVSNRVVSDDKALFTSDEDTFRLDERLLRLCMVQLWRQQKGQDFTAELADYEMALVKAKRDDGGSAPKLSGNAGGGRRSSNVWPGQVMG